MFGLLTKFGFGWLATEAALGGNWFWLIAAGVAAVIDVAYECGKEGA